MPYPDEDSQLAGPTAKSSAIIVITALALGALVLAGFILQEII